MTSKVVRINELEQEFLEWSVRKVAPEDRRGTFIARLYNKIKRTETQPMIPANVQGTPG